MKLLLETCEYVGKDGLDKQAIIESAQGLVEGDCAVLLRQVADDMFF